MKFYNFGTRDAYCDRISPRNRALEIGECVVRGRCFQDRSFENEEVRSHSATFSDRAFRKWGGAIAVL